MPSFSKIEAFQEKNYLVEEDSLISLIKEIYLEVKPVALVSPDGLREWQSFLGRDDDDTYKDDHLFILIQEKNGKIVMWLQITTFQAEIGQPRVKKATESKLIKAVLDNRQVVIEQNDYGPQEREKILWEILASIKRKKKLLSLR